MPVKETRTSKKSLMQRIRRELVVNRYNFLLLAPVLLYYILFHYWPMYGAQIAFRDYSPAKGILSSPWVGFQYFQQFFTSYYFGRLIVNTVKLSVFNLLWGFPAPVLLALLLNEVTHQGFKRVVQTITYLPHFISLVVICGIILDFTKLDGVVNQLIALFGGDRKSVV